jgi:MFS superfamily sulfate permease-like transporter
MRNKVFNMLPKIAVGTLLIFVGIHLIDAFIEIVLRNRSGKEWVDSLGVISTAIRALVSLLVSFFQQRFELQSSQEKDSVRP